MKDASDASAAPGGSSRLLVHPSSRAALEGRARWLRPLLVALVATGLVVALNLFIYRDQARAFANAPSTYFAVYHPAELPALTSFEFGRGTLTPGLSPALPADTTWSVSIDGGPPELQRGRAPLLPLPERSVGTQRRYLLTAEKQSLEIELEIERDAAGEVQLIASSIPFTTARRYSLHEFTDISWVPAGELQAARAVLSAQVRLDPAAPTLERIARLAAHLRGVIKGRPISPPAQERPRTGFEAYRRATGEGAVPSPREVAEMYNLFANLAGIPTRRVTVSGDADAARGVLRLSDHPCNESFVAEQGRWAFVDLVHDIAYVVNPAGQVLNAWQLLTAGEAGLWHGMQAASLVAGEVAMVPFEQPGEPEGGIFNRNATLAIEHGGDRRGVLGRLARYLLRPDPSLALGDHRPRVWLKTAAIASLIALLVCDLAFGVLLVSSLRWRRAMARPPARGRRSEKGGAR